MENQIVLKNKRVYDFYKAHPSISFEAMNVFLVDMLEKLTRNAQPSLDQTLASSLLEEMSKVKTQLAHTQQETNTQILVAMNNLKTDYMKDLQLLITNNNTEKLAPLVQQYNTTLEDKIRILIHELLPKTQEGVAKEVATSLKDLHHNIQKETNNLLNTSINKKTLDDFVSIMDNKFAKSLVSSQTFLNTMMTSTEQRITHKITENQHSSAKVIQELDSQIKQSQVNQKTLHANVSELLKKMENSSAKGKISENLLQHLLHHLYPTAEIDFVGTTKETGDIMMWRDKKPLILFENKNYDRNVAQEEVKKFLRDVEQQNCSGIMCAQHYGIANKENFHIDVHNGNVLIYLHAVEYSPEKIKTAVQIIDHFKMTMEDLDQGNDVIQLEKDTLASINKEYQLFVNAKLSQQKTIKEYSSKMLMQLEEWKMPQLEHIMSKYFASTVSKDYVCEYCGYPAKNARALTAHHRGCAEKKHMDSLPARKEMNEQVNHPEKIADVVQPRINTMMNTSNLLRKQFLPTHKDPRNNPANPS